ncbi:MAG: D-arabinono-1,4-lactone oxidase [Bacteroidota bacterium]
MKNWAKNIVWAPSEIAYPTSEAEIQQLVQRAANDRQNIRVIGSGHSFTPVCYTEDMLINLDNFQGLIHVDKENCQATVKAGTKLKALGEMLFREGLAMENLGDIDVQSIAGTISTGTHGTGTSFGTISTQVIALTFVNGKGEIVHCSESENKALFKAAQVSLGSLGIITEVTIQCVPIYKLHIQNKVESIEEVFGNLANRLTQNRNFEFYWFPHTDKALTKTTNIVDNAEVDVIGFYKYWGEYIGENLIFKLFCEYGTWFPSQAKAISKLTSSLITDASKIAYSHKVYATERLVRFMEMEYNVPADAYEEVWKELGKAMDKHNFHVHFPIENRWVKQDDIPLSPAYGRDSAYIACHVYQKKEYQPYFNIIQDIFKAHDGRPHWGKWHSLTAKDIQERYPELGTFLKHRAAQDPENIFLSDYLKALLGEYVYAQ